VFEVGASKRVNTKRLVQGTLYRDVIESAGKGLPCSAYSSVTMTGTLRPVTRSAGMSTGPVAIHYGFERPWSWSLCTLPAVLMDQRLRAP
jgi:GMP synthase PP-ATPase subunit